MKTQCLRTGRLILLMITMMVSTAFAQAQSAATATKAQEANALFQAKKWADAARAYEAITKVEATNGSAWFRLGVALHSLGRYAQAAGAFQKALEINQNPQAMYNLASSYARMNERESSFEWLKKALNAGFAQVGLLNTDPDLDSLRADARFKEILTLADKVTRPCMFSTEHRQFDFWLGDWNVENNGQQAGTNSVQSILDGCVLFENWTSARGGTGKSFNFYDSAKGKWQQTWVDSGGNVLNLTGEFKENALRFSGETPTKGGGVTMHRLTFFDLGAERVRQLWEQSTDGGKTWNTVWDGTYTRRR